MKPELKNTIKNVTLLVLTLLLAVLTIFGWMGELGLDSVPADSWLGRMYIGLSYGTAGGFTLRSGEIAAVQPVECAVWDGDSLQGAQYHELAVKSYLSVFAAPLTESIAKADPLQPGSADGFRQALSEPALYLRYDSALPLSLMVSWLGGETADAHDPQVETLLMTRQGVLWLRTDTQQYWCANTRTDMTALAAPAAAFSGYDCVFAAQAGAPYLNTGIHPDTLLFSDSLTLPVYTAAPIRFDTDSPSSLQQLLQAFGYEPYVSDYDDAASGKRIFVEAQSTLRVGENGEVVFRANTVEGGLEAYLDGELGAEDPLLLQIDHARLLLEAVAQSYPSDASFVFDSVQSDADSRTVQLTFRHALGGIPVVGSAGIFAVMEYQDNVLVSASLRLRTFAQSTQTVRLLASSQAASAAGEMPCALRVGYFVQEDGSCVPERYYLIDGKET